MALPFEFFFFFFYGFGVPGWGLPLGFGIVVEDKPSQLSCTKDVGHMIGFEKRG